MRYPTRHPLCAADDAAADPSKAMQYLPTPARDRDAAKLEAQLELRRRRERDTLAHYVLGSFHPTDAASVTARQRRRDSWNVLGSTGFGSWANKLVDRIIERRFNPREQLRFMFDVPWWV